MTRTVTVALKATNTEFDTAYGRSTVKVKALGDEVTKSTKKSHENMKTLGRTSLVMGAGLAAGFGLAAKATMDFDAAMSQVKTLSHANAAAMVQLRTAALHYGQAIGFSATQTADAEIELVKAGLSVEDIMGGALKGALELAAAGQIDVAEATTIAASAMTQFSLKGKDVPHIADLLAAGADKALGSVGDLGYGLSSSGTVAAQFGWSLEQTVGTLSEFAQNAQIGEKGGTLLRQMLLQLASPSKQASDLMSQYGLSIYDANGHMVDSSTLAGRLQASFGGLSEKARNAALGVIFGAHAIQGANILMKDGAAVNAKWVSSVNDAGFAARQAAGKMDNLKGDLSKLGSAFQSDLIEGGSQANTVLRGLTKGTTGLLHLYGGLSPTTQGVATAMIGLAGATALAGGAAAIAVPKYVALDEALLGLTGGAIGAKTALVGVGSVAGVATGIGAIYVAADQLGKVLDKAGPSSAALTDSLVQLAQTGKAGGEFTKTFGKDLDSFHDSLRKVVDPSFGDQFKHLGTSLSPIGHALDTDSFRATKRDVDALDRSLTELVGHGQASTAATAVGELGLSTEQARKYFKNYGKALDAAGIATTGAVRKTGDLANQQEQVKAKTDAATAALKAESDTLSATFDPLLGMVKATRAQADAQKAASKAIKDHGAKSKEAAEANLGVLQSTVDLNVAVLKLQQGLSAGTTSIADANTRLDQFAAQGLISARQADQFKAALARTVGTSDRLARSLDTLGHKNVRPYVRIQAGDAVGEINTIARALAKLHDRTLTISIATHQTSLRAAETQLGIPHADGGEIHGPGTGTSDTAGLFRLSDGEFVVKAARAQRHMPLLKAINDAPGFATGGLVGSPGMAGGGPVTFDPRHGTLAQQSRWMVVHGRSADDIRALSSAYDDYLHKLDEAAQRQRLLHDLSLAKTKQEKSAARQALRDFDVQSYQDKQKARADADAAWLERKATWQQEQADKRAAAAQKRADALALSYQIQDNKFSLGLVSAKAEEASLTKRMGLLTKYSDEWMSLYQQRQQILDADRQSMLDTVTVIDPARTPGHMAGVATSGYQVPTGPTVPYSGTRVTSTTPTSGGIGVQVNGGIQLVGTKATPRETVAELAWLGR